MRIAVIGWGSLIWDPRELPVQGGWRPNGPKLPVEFARFSGGDRLTLVLLPGVPLQPSLWTLSQSGSLQQARRDLKEREEVALNNIGVCAKEGAAGEGGLGSELIVPWLHEVDLDGAVWTTLSPNRPDKTAGMTTVAERMSWLRELVELGKADAAKQYILRTPVQIATPFRSLVGQEMGWR